MISQGHGYHFNKGDEIAVTGSRVKQEAGDLILAREVVKGTDTLVLRDGKGRAGLDLEKSNARFVVASN